MGLFSEDYGSLKKCLALTFIFFTAISVSSFLIHEPWQDEAQAWLIARDVGNFFDIFNYTAYNGAPFLWYSILYFLNILHLPYESMSVVHAFISIFIAFLVLYKSPFHNLTKIFLVLSYFFLYEYNVISRNYSLSILLLFLVTVYWPDFKNNCIKLALVISLLAQTNVHSLYISIILGIYFLYNFHFRSLEKLKISHVLAISIIIISFSLAFYQLLPPEDLISKTSEWNFQLTGLGSRFLRSTLNAFMPISLETYYRDNSSNIFYNLYEVNFILPYFLTFIIFLASILTFKTKKSKLLYLSLVAGLYFIFLFKYVGFSRHHGFIFISYLFCIWFFHENKLSMNYKLMNVVLFIHIFLGLIFSLHAYYLDFHKPFSPSRNTYKYIKSKYHLDSVFIATFDSFKALPSLPYFYPHIEKFYHIETNSYNSFITENVNYEKGKMKTPIEVVDDFYSAFENSKKKYGIFLLPIRSHNPVFDKHFIKEIVYDENIEETEDVVIYRALIK